tara:strand:- start:42 stop:620 length:579 start_codon:yes stop_codon:yes gene_type:complete
MSTLGFCNLEEAFNNSTIKKKKKSRKYDMDKILQRGSDIDITNNDIDRPGEIPSNCTNTEEINALPFTYDANNKYAKLREQTNLAEQRARDQEPNEIQHKKNEEAMDFMKQIQTQIFKLTEEVKNLKEKPPVVQDIGDNKVREGFANYQSAFPRKNMTFDNDQFNELLLYVFTGIFILILIDYIYKLGKKSF